MVSKNVQLCAAAGCMGSTSITSHLSRLAKSLAAQFSVRCLMEIKECPFCGSDAVFVRDPNIFYGQSYSDRYPKDVANQNHGFRIRCVKCGCCTCWWHYKTEAIKIWNNRHLTSRQSRAANACALWTSCCNVKSGCPNPCTCYKPPPA